MDQVKQYAFRPGIEVGLLTIAWDKRSFELRGIYGDDDGNSNDPVTPEEVLSAFDNRDSNTDVYAVVFWHDNNQLVLADKELFMQEHVEEIASE